MLRFRSRPGALLLTAFLALTVTTQGPLMADDSAPAAATQVTGDNPPSSTKAAPTVEDRTTKVPAAAVEKSSGEKATAAKQPTSSGNKEIDALFQHYADAFNKADAVGIGKLWTANGEYLDRNDDSRTVGRAALEAGLLRQFKDEAGGRISVTVKQVRLVRPDVASVEGESQLVAPGKDPQVSEFSALVVRDGDRWVFDRVEESIATTPTSSHAALADLEWMIGHWKDDTPGAEVDTVVRWSDSQSFLIRSFTVKTDEMEEARRGTQVIGWDAKNKQIRSWTFDADGSFGEGTWTHSGNEWLVRMRYTLADGGTSSATQVITRLDDDTLTVQSIGQELDGEPQPASPVIKVVRTADNESDAVGSK